LYADISDPFARNYFLVRGFDPEFFSIASPFLSDGGVFFDVGANFGFCSFGLIDSLTRNDIEYHLFEANAHICRLLSQTANLYHDQNTIFINHCCVTDTLGVSRLYLDCENFGSSFISEDGLHEAENLILDNYIRKRSISKIHFLKVDIEGWEVRALKGAINSLATGVIENIYIEVSTTNLSRAGFSAEDCFVLLRDNGFQLFYVRALDFESGIADTRKAFTLDINGCLLKVARIEEFPKKHLTDILAIHNSSRFLKTS
jgi:FkbM family methyltransferase